MQSALGRTHPYYEKLLALADDYSWEWNYINSSGWILKVYDSKKALFYLIPLKGGFKLSLTLRSTEHATFLRDRELAGVHAALSASKKYPEGFALQFDITNKSGFQPLELFITKLIALRA